MFIKLTRLATGRPTHIDVDHITCVTSNHRGDTLVLFGKDGQYVAEDEKTVVDTVESMKRRWLEE